MDNLNPSFTRRRQIVLQHPPRNLSLKLGTVSFHFYLYGGAFTVYSAESLCPSIIANVENHKSDCTVENLLRGMLSLCSPEEDEQNLTPDLLDSCLKAVLPICNADAETKEKGLRDYLNE